MINFRLIQYYIDQILEHESIPFFKTIIKYSHLDQKSIIYIYFDRKTRFPYIINDSEVNKDFYKEIDKIINSYKQDINNLIKQSKYLQ